MLKFDLTPLAVLCGLLVLGLFTTLWFLKDYQAAYANLTAESKQLRRNEKDLYFKLEDAARQNEEVERSRNHFRLLAKDRKFSIDTLERNLQSAKADLTLLKRKLEKSTIALANAGKELLKTEADLQQKEAECQAANQQLMMVRQHNRNLEDSIQGLHRQKVKDRATIAHFESGLSMSGILTDLFSFVLPKTKPDHHQLTVTQYTNPHKSVGSQTSQPMSATQTPTVLEAKVDQATVLVYPKIALLTYLGFLGFLFILLVILLRRCSNRQRRRHLYGK